MPYRTEQALAVLEPAAAEFADLDDDPGFLAVLGQLARGYMLTEQRDRAVAVADRALPAAERADLVALVADLLVTKGTALGASGRTYEGPGVIGTGLRLAEQHGLVVTALRARLNSGYLQSKVDLRQAIEGDRIGLAEARRLGQQRWALLFMTNAAADSIWIGEWDWARRELADALSGELEREDRILVLGRMAILEAWRGAPVDSLLDEMERLLGVAPDPNNARFIGEVNAARTFAQGEFALAAGVFRTLARNDVGNARHSLNLAARAAILGGDGASAAADLDALERTGVHGPWTDGCKTSIRAGLAALDGRVADALSLYRTALRLLREVDVPLDVALTGLEMAVVLDLAVPEVRAAAEASREILARLGARSLLERLELAMVPPALPAVADRSSSREGSSV
jgi:tetratricopeptide (TPR) repeat protein